MSDEVTLALDGEASLDDFSRAVRSFNTLVTQLSKDVAQGTEINWVIASLEVGSAVATVRGEVEADSDRERVDAVVAAYASVGEALETQSTIPYGDRVVQAAQDLRGIINGRVRSVRFETAEADHTIFPSTDLTALAPAELRQAYGELRGRVQTLTNRGALRFTLYDLTHDKAVGCYLQEGQQEMMRDLWGQLVRVKGWIARDPETGIARTVRQITEVEAVAEGDPSGWRRAQGVAPWSGEERPEQVVRRLRDA